MKTPQQIRNEVEKGCGELFKPEHFGITCGERSPLTGNIMLCEICEAKLSILTEYDKSIKEKIEELREELKDMFYYRTTEGKKIDICLEKIDEIFNKEFISKLEDDEVKE